MADWFHFRVSPPISADERTTLKAFAGVRIKSDGSSFWVGRNAAWLVTSYLESIGRKLKLLTSPKSIAPLTELPPIYEMRQRVSGIEDPYPNYLLPWQRDFVLRFGAGSGFAWLPPGAGKTLTALLWALSKPGLIVFVTRSGARRTIANDVRRYTIASYCILEGESQKTIPPDTRIVITGWDTLIHHVDMLCAAHPTSVVLDEIHRAKQSKRRVAVPKRTDDGEAVFNAKGELEIEFHSRKNTSAAAEQLAKAAQRRMGSTASPVKDRLRDFWAQLDLVEPGQWGNFLEWCKRYTGATENLYGGYNTGGVADSSYVQELNARLSLSVLYLPYHVTHGHLPPKRRQVTYIPQDQLLDDAGAEARKGLEEAAIRAKNDEGMALAAAQLAATACRKRNAVAEIIVEEDLGEKTKIVVFTGLRKEAVKLHAAISKKLPEGVQTWCATGDQTVNERDAIREEYMAHPGPCILVGTAAAWGECVAPDTLLLGQENKVIGAHTKGDLTLSPNGLAEIQGKKTRPFKGKMVQIHATGLLPFATTPDHPVFVLEGRHHGNRLVLAKSPRELKSIAVRPWKGVLARTPGHFLLLPRLPGRLTIKEFDLEKYVDPSCRQGRRTRGLAATLPLTEDTAWLLGLYAAEGSASPRSRAKEAWRAQFSLHKDEAYIINRLRKTLTSCGFKSTVNPAGDNGVNITVRSTPLALKLRELLGACSHDKQIPLAVLLHKDLKIVHAFLEGYVEGDGSVCGHKVQAGTVSRTLALGIQLALARLGRLCKVSTVRGTPHMIRGRRVRPGFSYALRWTTADRWRKRHVVLENFIAVPVKTTKEIDYDGEVVDIETNDHTFLVANAVVHNSINLHDTDVAEVAMLPFTPGEIIQSEGRFSRQGQKRPVRIRYLVAEGTFDEHVAQLLLNKLPAVEKLAPDSEVAGFGTSLAGIDDPDAVLDALLSKVTSSTAELDDE